MIDWLVDFFSFCYEEKYNGLLLFDWLKFIVAEKYTPLLSSSWFSYFFDWLKFIIVKKNTLKKIQCSSSRLIKVLYKVKYNAHLPPILDWFKCIVVNCCKLRSFWLTWSSDCAIDPLRLHTLYPVRINYVPCFQSCDKSWSIDFLILAGMTFCFIW